MKRAPLTVETLAAFLLTRPTGEIVHVQTDIDYDCYDGAATEVFVNYEGHLTIIAHDYERDDTECRVHEPVLLRQPVCPICGPGQCWTWQQREALNPHG